MANETCKECKRALVLDEENLCAYCELTQDESAFNNVNCGICKDIVEEDSEGLFCDVCNSWFHNNCNKTPLNYELYALLNEAPDNVKWFCDKCIWETEKWIKEVNSKHKNVNNKLVIKEEDISDSTFEVDDPESHHGDSDTDVKSSIQKEKGNVTNNTNAPRKRKSGRLKGTCKKDKIPSALTKTRTINNKSRNSTKNDSEKIDKPSVAKIDEYPDESDNGDLPGDINEFETTDPEFKPIESDSDYSDKDRKKKKSKKHPFGKPKVKITKAMRESKYKHQCPFCKKGKFQHLETLERHLKIHEEKEVVCPECNRTFKSEAKLAGHKGYFHKTKTHDCEECGKKFNTNNQLIQHMRGHTGEKPFACTLCDYRTAVKGSLKSHIAVRHTDEKPHLCSTCGYRSYSACQLKKHLRTHTGEKPYLCSTCGKNFATEKNLKEHVMIHTGVKPYQCNVCGYRCIQKGVLNSHMKRHTSKLHNLTSQQNGTSHDENTQKLKIQPLQKSKPSSDSNASDSNSSDSVPHTQPNPQPPPLLVYTGGNDKSMAPVYPSSHHTGPPTGRGGHGLYGDPSRLSNPSSFFSYYSL